MFDSLFISFCHNTFLSVSVEQRNTYTQLAASHNTVHYVACSKSFRPDNEEREVCCGREVEGTFKRICGFFSANWQRHSRAVNVWVRVYTQCVLHFYFLRKWRNNSSSSIASNFATSLAITKWKPLTRFIGFLAKMSQASHKLSDTTGLNMAACRWRATLVPVGPQQANG